MNQELLDNELSNTVTNVNTIDNTGTTSLMHAVNFNWVSACPVKLLLEAGADINIKNLDGLTAGLF